jgi:outer membrane protein assembly factor BamB
VKRFATPLICLLTLPATFAAPVGWNRDGSASFPDASPPPAFNGDTGQGILWKARLPNWSNSSPIVVETADGPRVILLSEPWDSYSPWLLCLDAVTGQELWRRELDAVSLLPAEQQERARALARKMWDLARLRKRLTAEIQAIRVKDGAGFTGKEVPEEAKPLVEAAHAAGFDYRGISQSAGGYPNHLDMRSKPIEKEMKELTALGLMPSDWDYQGTWDGVAYPTPIGDGTRIWTITMHNLYSCHDMTGKVLWAHPMRGEIGQALGVPALATVAGERYVVCVDNERKSTAFVPIYRLRDGALAAELPATTCNKGGVSGPVVEGDLILARPHGVDGALVAHRLQSTGNGIGWAEVWKLGKGDRREESISLFRPAWRDGRLYNGGAMLDLRTGKWLASRRALLNGGYYGGGGILVGSAFLSWDFYGSVKSSDKTTPPQRARFVWVNPETGQQLGEGFLPVNPADGHALAFKRAQACRDSWRWLTAATPFAHQGRLYVRAYDFLWCIGRE